MVCQCRSKVRAKSFEVGLNKKLPPEYVFLTFFESQKKILGINLCILGYNFLYRLKYMALGFFVLSILYLNASDSYPPMFKHNNFECLTKEFFHV